MLECLKDWSSWEPEAAKEFNDSIDQLLADEAGVEVDTFRSARSIISWDGWFGPFSDEDYAQEGHKITKTQALKIIEDGMQYRFHDIEFFNPDYYCTGSHEGGEDWNCPPNYTISGSLIYDEVWGWY